MYLLDVQHYIVSGQLRLRKFSRLPNTGYAILSHTWLEDEEEVSFPDLTGHRQVSGREGLKKIRLTCELAFRDKLDYAWVDTCCIDKASSSELSESINSMYRWYRSAAVCYVFLSDMPGKDRRTSDAPDVSEMQPDQEIVNARLRECRWFTRGWTLQELIAPSQIKFFDEDWDPIGTKKSLLPVLSAITGIDPIVLSQECSLEEISVAKKFSWAAERQTTRVEDQTYCLLGLLDVNMSLLYGEGEKAFVRLQEEICRKTTDSSILTHIRDNDDPVLASSPSAFQACGKVVLCGSGYIDFAFEIVQRGYKMTLPLIQTRPGPIEQFLAVLNCRTQDDFETMLCLHLERERGDPMEDDAMICSIEPCGCDDARVLDSKLSVRLHRFDVGMMRKAKYRTVFLPRPIFNGRRSKRFSDYESSVWIRRLPEPLRAVDAFPANQWNLQTRVMDVYKRLERPGVLCGGVVLRYKRRDINVCFYLGSACEFVEISDGAKDTLANVCDAISSRQNMASRRGAHYQFRGSTAQDQLVRVSAELASDRFMGEIVFIVDLDIAISSRSYSGPLISPESRFGLQSLDIGKVAALGKNCYADQDK